MKKLSKEHHKKIGDAQTFIEEKRAAYQAAAEQVNEQIWEARSALDDLNSAIESYNAVREEIADEAQAYYDDRTDAWRDGDNGEAYLAWIETFREEMEAAEPQLDDVDELDEVEYPDFTDAPES